MNKVIELAIEADSATGFHIACIEAQKIKPFLERFYALSRADLEAENAKLKHNVHVLTDALWKSCGDDEETVNATIESQGVLK